MTDGVIGGKYRLEGVLGSGAFGTVYQARHEEIGRTYALKLLEIPPELRGDEERVRTRFLREAKILGRLDHPNTVQVVDFGEHEGRPYLVTELLQGRTLREVLRGEGPLDEHRVHTIGEQCLRALSQAHQLGIVHRDLKPTNVMIVRDRDGAEVTKLLDFGIATVFRDDGPAAARQLAVTERGTFLGTPQYAAPEQFGGSAGPPADVYAVGLLMWEMLTGKAAVPPGSVAECMVVHSRGEPWRLPASARVTRELRVVVERALERAPAARYDDASAMLEALAGVAAARTEAPRTVSTVVSAPEPADSPEVIAGKYELGGLIGAGGFSRVYKARHVEMRRTVALKLLDLAGAVALAGNTTASDLEKRFSREARVVSTLTHPNTITVYDFGFDAASERWYIAMEFVDGMDLHLALRKQGAFMAERAARVASDVLRALEEAHHHGILHRDLKPANVMLTKDFAERETVKVLDFGVATITGVGRDGHDDIRAMTATLSGGFVGTPQYAAPEQFAGDRLTPATDIYAVGLLLWEMLLGEAAVGDAAFGKCLQRHLDKVPWRFPPGSDVPDGLAAIAYGALKKDPSERYGSAASMADDLEKWLAGDRDSFAPAPATVQAWEPALDYGTEEPAVIDPNLGTDVPELLRPPIPVEKKPVAVEPRRAAPRREAPLELDYSRAGARIEGSDRVVRPSDARPPRRRQRSQVSPRLVGGIVAAVALALVGYSLFPSESQERIDLDELVATEPMHIDLRTNGALPRQPDLNRFTAAGILRALEIDGWSVRRKARSSELSLANVHEQGYWLSRGGAELQIELVTTKSHEIAGKMAMDTRSPILPVVFDNKMVRVFPPTRGPGGGSAEVASLLVKYRDLVLSTGDER